MNYLTRNIKLSKLAEITTGLNYSKRDLASNIDSIPLIQVKDIQNFELNHSNIPRIKNEKTDKRLILNKDDVIFASKGTRNFAYYYRNDLGNVTVSSTFFIIRIKKDIITPEYLCWYLNSKIARDYFKNNVRGSYIPSITKSSLEKLNISVPAFEVQNKIVRISELQRKEKQITEQIINKRDILVESIINKKLITHNEQ